jgi:hypothetical protein
MNRQHIFPAMAFSEGTSETSIKLEGQKVVFDKKVSLMPADVRKEEPVKMKPSNGRPERQRTA